MYRKGFISNEIQKLAQVLARIIGLKKEGNIEEAHKEIGNMLQDSFGLGNQFIDSVTGEEFKSLLIESNYSEEKLNILAQLLFESAHPFEDIPEIQNRLHLVLAVFNRIEKEYHTQSLDNIAKRQMIDKFLNTAQYE